MAAAMNKIGGRHTKITLDLVVLRLGLQSCDHLSLSCFLVFTMFAFQGFCNTGSRSNNRYSPPTNSPKMYSVFVNYSAHKCFYRSSLEYVYFVLSGVYTSVTMNKFTGITVPGSICSQNNVTSWSLAEYPCSCQWRIPYCGTASR